MLASAAVTIVSGSDNESSIQGLHLVKFVEPDFPTQLQTLGIPVGDVTLAVSRDSSGTPSDILTIESTHELFAVAAVTAVQQWRFTPSEAGNSLQTTPVVLRIRFSMQGVVFLDPTITTAESNALQSNPNNRPVLIPNLQMLDPAHQPVVAKMPVYPQLMAARGVEGEARVAFYIDREGKVRMPHVVAATTPEFGTAAMVAVADWRFAPPRKNNGPTIAADSWSFEFKRNH